MKQKLTVLGVVLVLLVGGLWYYGGTKTEIQNTSEENSGNTTAEPKPTSGSAPAQNTPTTPQPSLPSAGKARVVFAVTDAATSFETIKSIDLTVTGLEMHHVGRGWIKVPTGSKTYSLLDLRRESALELLADVNLEKGDYTQIRLTVGKVLITYHTGMTAEAKLPSGELRIVTRFTIKDEGATAITFDFLADKSLHTTGSGGYIFAPVVKTSVRGGAVIAYIPKNRVQVAAGTTPLQLNHGMDESGDTRENFSIDPLAKLDFVGSAIKVIPQNESEVGVSVSASQAIDIAVRTGKITAALSIRITTKADQKVWVVVGNKGAVRATVQVNAKTGAIVE